MVSLKTRVVYWIIQNAKSDCISWYAMAISNMAAQILLEKVDLSRLKNF